jgi:hypothetical protein
MWLEVEDPTKLIRSQFGSVLHWSMDYSHSIASIGSDSFHPRRVNSLTIQKLGHDAGGVDFMRRVRLVTRAVCMVEKERFNWKLFAYVSQKVKHPPCYLPIHSWLDIAPKLKPRKHSFGNDEHVHEEVLTAYTLIELLYTNNNQEQVRKPLFLWNMEVHHLVHKTHH